MRDTSEPSNGQQTSLGPSSARVRAKQAGISNRASALQTIRIGAADGRTFDVIVKRQPGARRFTLRVGPRGDVVLAAPHRVSLLEAIRFAQNHADWVAQRRAALPQAVPFVPGAIIPVRGVPHLVEHRDGRGTVWLETEGEADPDAAPRLCVAGAAAHISRRILDALAAWSRLDLSEATARHCRALGVRTPAIQIRDPVSRWGSCSATGTISFSWRLILAPPFVLDYLAAHEAAHLVHMNHSPAYWRLLEGLSPDVARAERWLNEHGPALHRYGREAAS